MVDLSTIMLILLNLKPRPRRDRPSPAARGRRRRWTRASSKDRSRWSKPLVPRRPFVLEKKGVENAHTFLRKKWKKGAKFPQSNIHYIYIYIYI